MVSLIASAATASCARRLAAFHIKKGDPKDPLVLLLRFDFILEEE